MAKITRYWQRFGGKVDLPFSFQRVQVFRRKLKFSCLVLLIQRVERAGKTDSGARAAGYLAAPAPERRAKTSSR